MKAPRSLASTVGYFLLPKQLVPFFLFTALVGFAISPGAFAAERFWYGDVATCTEGVGGKNGFWVTAGTWKVTDDGICPGNANWVNGDDAVFTSGEPGATVVLTGNATPDRIHVKSGGYLFMATAVNTRTITITTGRFTVDSGSATIGRAAAGSAHNIHIAVPSPNPLIVDGAGELQAHNSSAGIVLWVDKIKISGGGTYRISAAAGWGNTAPATLVPDFLTISNDSIFRIQTTTGGGANRGITIGSGGGRIQVNNANTVSAPIAGDGALTIQGNNVLTLNADNSTFTGQININGTATLAITGGLAIADTSIVNITETTAAILRVDTSETIGQLTGGSTSFGSVTLNGAGIGLTVGNASDFAYNGNITGVGNLAKIGAGTMTLGRATTFTGNTTVSVGTLALSGSGAIASSAIISVASGATLDATGRTNGTLTVATAKTLTGNGTVAGTVSISGTLKPGASVGEISTDSQIWNGGGAYEWEINDADGPDGWDQIIIDGTLDITATPASKFNINITSLAGAAPGDAANFNNANDYSWTIATTTDGITGFNPNAFNLDTTAFSNSQGSGIFNIALANGDKDLVVRFVHPPEITAQPGNLTVTVEDEAVFTVEATGVLAYQWYKNGLEISGATESSYTIGSVFSTHAGSYSVAVANASGSQVSSAAILTVNKANQTIDFDALADKTYGDADFAVSATASSGLPVTFSIFSGPATIVGGNNVHLTGANPVMVRASQAGNADYNAATPVDQGFSVAKAAALTVTAINTNVYGSTPVLTPTYIGLVNPGDESEFTGAPELSTTATSASTVAGGPYLITVGLGDLASDNYELQASNGELTVIPATLTVTADDDSRAYGAANPTFTAEITGYVNGEDSGVVDGSPDLATIADASSPVGEYPITVAVGTLEADNYSFSPVAGTLTVTKAGLTVTVDDTNRVYGATNEFTASFSGFVNDDDESVVGGEPTFMTLADTNSPASETPYEVTVSIGTLTADNYDFTTFVPGELTITKAPLIVTAENTNRTYGAANPSFVLKYVGFVNDDTASVVTGDLPTLDSAATPASPIGDYDITVTGGTLTADNYEITPASATLTVTVASLTVTADDKSRPFGQPNPTFTGQIDGIQNDDDITATYASEADSLSPIGDYDIVPTLANQENIANYDVTLVNGTLTVGASFEIVTQPTDQEVIAGDDVEFTVETAGSVGALTYQWYKGEEELSDAGNVSGATTDTLTLTSVSQANAGDYTVEVTEGAQTLTSEIATLTVIDPVVIAAGPDDQTNNYGTTATFTVSVSGTPPFTYEWKKGEVTLSDGGEISGSTTATLTIENVDWLDSGTYAVIVTNDGGSDTNSATLTVIDPIITAQPQSQTTGIGRDNLTFTVVVSGSETLTYQWRFATEDSPEDILDATSSSYTLNNVQLTDAGNYSVVVVGPGGSVTSSVAVLTVTEPVERFWSGNGTTLGGTGTWDTTLPRWGADAAGPFDGAWNNDKLDTAIFAGTPAAVIPGVVTVDRMLLTNSTAAAYSFTGSGTITLDGANREISVPGANNTSLTNTVTVTAKLAGSVVTKSSGGRLLLNNTNNSVGKWIVNGGALVGSLNSVFAADGLFGTGNPALPTADFITLDGSGLGFSGGAASSFLLGENRGIYLGPGGGLIGVNGATPTIDARITGPGDLHFPGTTEFPGGTVGANSTITISNPNNSYGGQTRIATGEIRCGNDYVFPVTTTIDITNGTLNGRLNLNGTHQAVTKVILHTTSGNSRITDSLFSGTLTADEFELRRSAYATAPQVSAVFAGSGFLRKTLASSTVTMSAAHTYTGDTIIEEGTLSLVTFTFNATLTNEFTSSGSFDNSPNISIASGATLNVTGRSDGTLLLGSAQTLSGNGTVAGIVEVNGTLSPGASVGKLNIGTNIWNGGGKYKLEVNSATGTAGASLGWDQVDIANGLDIMATPGSPFTIKLTSLTLEGEPGEVADFSNTGSYSWSIAKTTIGITGFDPDALVLDTSEFANNLGSGEFSITTNATDVLLVFVPRDQAITFAALSDRTYGESFNLAATASSGLPVSFSLVSGPASLVGNAVTVTGVGAITIRASQAGNDDYEAAPNVDQMFTAVPAILTVTADDKTRVSGSTNPTFTVTYTGFVNDETLETSDLAGSPTLTTSATQSSPAGSYVITNTVGSLTSANYTFSFVDGALTVQPLVNATYYSQGSVDPNALANWNSDRLGAGVAPTTFTNSGDSFVIQDTHNMTNTAALTVNGKIQIENSGILVSSAGRISAGTGQVDNGGTFIVANVTGANGSALDILGTNKIYAANSTIEIQRWGDGTGSGLNNFQAGITWGNIVINITNNMAAGWQQSGVITNVLGNLVMKSLGTSTNQRDMRLNANTPTPITINIGGDIQVSGGILTLISGTSIANINVGGTIQVTGGLLQSTGTGVPIISVAGNSGKIAVSGGGTNLLSGNYANPPASPEADSITLDNGTFGVSGVDFTLTTNRGITVAAAGGSLFTASGRTLTIPGNITGPGGLTKTYSTGTTVNLTLSGTNDFEGDFVITGGGVRFNSDYSAGTGKVIVSPPGGAFTANTTLRNTGVPISTLTNDVVFNANNGTRNTLDSDVANTFVMSGNFSGIGAVSHGINSGGTVVLSGDNSAWSGGLTALRGTLQLGHKNALGAGTYTVAPAGASGAMAVSLQAGTPLLGANAVTNAVQFATTNISGVLTSSWYTISGANDLELSGPISLGISGSSSPIITNNNSGATILSGIISGTGFGITNVGTGVLTLSGDNTFDGGVTVGGTATLKVANVSGSATGSGAVNVLSSATLTGSGSIAGTVTIGGTVSPGTSPGSIATGSETWSGGGRYKWEINDATGAAGTGFDQIVVTGSLNITANSGSKFNIDLTSLAGGIAGEAANFNNTVNQSWTILTTTTGITGFDTNAFALNTGAFANSVGSGSFGLTNSGNDLVLTFTVPVVAAEPTDFVSTSAGTGSFVGTPGATYTVQYTDSFTPIDWQTLTNVVTDSGTGVGSFADPTDPATRPERYYRITVP